MYFTRNISTYVYNSFKTTTLRVLSIELVNVQRPGVLPVHVVVERHALVPRHLLVFPRHETGHVPRYPGRAGLDVHVPAVRGAVSVVVRRSRVHRSRSWVCVYIYILNKATTKHFIS